MSKLKCPMCAGGGYIVGCKHCDDTGVIGTAGKLTNAELYKFAERLSDDGYSRQADVIRQIIKRRESGK